MMCHPFCQSRCDSEGVTDFGQVNALSILNTCNVQCVKWWRRITIRTHILRVERETGKKYKWSPAPSTGQILHWQSAWSMKRVPKSPNLDTLGSAIQKELPCPSSHMTTAKTDIKEEYLFWKRCNFSSLFLIGSISGACGRPKSSH